MSLVSCVRPKTRSSINLQCFTFYQLNVNKNCDLWRIHLCKCTHEFTNDMSVMLLLWWEAYFSPCGTAAGGGGRGDEAAECIVTVYDSYLYFFCSRRLKCFFLLTRRLHWTQFQFTELIWRFCSVIHKTKPIHTQCIAVYREIKSRLNARRKRRRRQKTTVP